MGPAKRAQHEGLMNLAETGCLVVEFAFIYKGYVYARENL